MYAHQWVEPQRADLAGKDWIGLMVCRIAGHSSGSLSSSGVFTLRIDVSQVPANAWSCFHSKSVGLRTRSDLERSRILT